MTELTLIACSLLTVQMKVGGFLRYGITRIILCSDCVLQGTCVEYNSFVTVSDALLDFTVVVKKNSGTK